VRVPVAHLNMDLVVTGSAEGHKVLFVVSATAGYGKDVMDLLHQRDSSFLQTHFTEWVLGGVVISDALPGAAICLIYVWTPLVSVVLLSSCLLVQGAVLFVRQFGAAWICTRVLWLFGHGNRPS